MSLPPGRMLGPYQVLSPIGAGGMGEVLKAKDTTKVERGPGAWLYQDLSGGRGGR